MLVLTMVAQKGGVGRTMLARSLAVQGVIEGRKTAILDLDPQGTCLLWSQRRGSLQAPTVIGPEGRSVADRLDELRQRGADMVVIDTPPHTQPIINAALAATDAAILVTGPFPEDLEQVGPAAAMVRALRLPCVLVLNKTPARSGALALARSALATFQMPICPTAITQLHSHPYASAEGLTAQEREPRSRATDEVLAVWSFIKTSILGSMDASRLAS
jgi:chromosome partitioning protein